MPADLKRTSDPIESSYSNMSCRGQSPAASILQKDAWSSNGTSGEHTRLACWFSAARRNELLQDRHSAVTWTILMSGRRQRHSPWLARRPMPS